MKAQFTNNLVSSFLLWADHTILDKGEAFSNVNSLFYRINDTHTPYYTYANPFGQIVADTSISGMVPFTGVYVNNIFTTKGQNGLVDIDYNKGRLYFNTPINSIISGNYSIKDFNVVLTNESEQRLLTETEYKLRPKTNVKITGLENNERSYPVIFAKSLDGNNLPMAFGGMDNTKSILRLTILADNLFYLDAVTSILRDTAKTYIPLIMNYEMPFNSLGGYNTGIYNYTGLVVNKIQNNQASFVLNSYTFKPGIGTLADFKKFNPEMHIGIVDLTIETYRYPRV
jgi:hypothetical protein